MLSNILDKISFYALFFTIVLLPVFFLPFTSVPIETSKGILFVIGLVISVVSFAAARFSDGKISIPKSSLLLSLFLLPLVFLISSLFSSSYKASLFGVLMDYSTFWFVFCVSLLTLMISLNIKEEKKIKFVLKGLFISFSFLFLFQFLHIFYPKMLSLGMLFNKTNNILGSFNSLGILSGLALLICIYFLEFIHLKKKQKIFISILIAFSLFFVISANFLLIWQLIGIFSLILFVYKISIHSLLGNEEERHKKKFPIISFATIILSLLFIISGRFIGPILPNLLQIDNFEINPTISTTYDIGKEVFKKDIVFGIGPNKFNEAWSLYKPEVINYSDFWNSSFSFGFGTLPTFVIMTGLLGFLSLLLFIILFLFTGFKNVFKNIKEKENNYLILSFMASLYLLISSIFYPSGIVLFLFLFIFLGIFIGISFHKEEKNINIKYLEDPRKSFFSILILIVIMIVSLGLSFKYIERFVSVFHFQNTIKNIAEIMNTPENATEHISKAELSINKALILNQNDLYYRTYVEVNLLKMNSLINSKKELTDQDKMNLKSYLDNSVKLATEAVKYNGENYLNYEILGLVHKNYAILGGEKDGELSVEAYKKASTLNPKNPQLKLEIAQIYTMLSNTKEAREYGEASVLLKDNYLDALIFLADLENSAGNNKEAIFYAEKAQAYYPQSEELNNYVNSLKNNKKVVEVKDVTEENN